MFFNQTMHSLYKAVEMLKRCWRIIEEPWRTITTLALGSRPKQKGLQGCEPRGSPGIKAKALQGCKPRGSRGVTSHTPGSVRKCEGVSPHTPKATPTLGDGVPMDFQNFRELL